MPEPTTTAARNALPSSLANKHLQRAARSSGNSAARRRWDRRGTDRDGCGLAHLGNAAPTVPGDTCLDRRIGEHGVDLPRVTLGVFDPNLVLDSEAVRGLVPHLGGQPLTLLPKRGRYHLIRWLHLDAEVVEGTLDPVSSGVGVLVDASADSPMA